MNEHDRSFDEVREQVLDFLKGYEPEAISDNADKFVRAQPTPQGIEEFTPDFDMEDFAHPDIFLAKFYEEYDLKRVKEIKKLPEEVNEFYTLYKSWNAETCKRLERMDNPSSKSALETVSQLSFRQAQIFARRRHIFFRTKANSNTYDAKERLEYGNQALTWERNVKLAHWAEVWDNKLNDPRK